MNAQKELVLDNYKKDSKAAYETRKICLEYTFVLI